MRRAPTIYNSAGECLNHSRKQRKHKTPWELIHEREPQINPAICALPPVFLDELFMRKLDAKLR